MPATDARLLDLKPSIIILTGYSGLLRHHLLNTFMAQPSIRNIICVTVRKLSEPLKRTNGHLLMTASCITKVILTCLVSVCPIRRRLPFSVRLTR